MTNKGEGRLGEMLVREGLITDAQLADALREQQGRPTYVPLGHILVEQRLVTRRQLNLLLENAEKRPRLGELLVRSGADTAAQLAHALERQRTLRLPLGQVLIRLGYTTEKTMRDALALQLNMRVIARMLGRSGRRRF